MLFTSYEFVLVFLPVVLLTVLGATAFGQRSVAKTLLMVASLVFYAQWSPTYVVLLVAILGFNFTVGSWLIRTASDDALANARLAMFSVGLLANITALVYFKYANFFVNELSALLGTDLTIAPIVLPLGLSFITFQKIAFLVDAYAGKIGRLSFLDYGLFVTFFPQLIAGPIVHHREVIPQFESPRSLRYSVRIVPIAITFFVFGAFKKVVIADQLSPFVAQIFDRAAVGHDVGMAAAWLGSLTFTLQVYFDFSGYSDMAIGLALLFGVRLPFNFNSPLKASSIIDFWSRWHMTLTRFLTAYIYNPIVMRATRRHMMDGKKIATRGVMSSSAFIKLLAIPTLLTMFIAGLWHGAGVQFIVFGLIHGTYLVANHAWRNIRRAMHVGAVDPPKYGVWIARALTLAAIVASIPFFRADTASTGWRLLEDMVGAGGLRVGEVLNDKMLLLVVGVFLVATQVLPNTQEIMRDRLDAETTPLIKHAGDGKVTDVATRAWSWPRITWRPTIVWALALGALGWYVLLSMSAPTEFLYFQF